MSIQEMLLLDLKIAIKNKDVGNRDNLKVIVSELQRGKSKTLSDEETIIILRRLRGWEEDRLAKSKQADDSGYLDLLNKYIPEQIFVDESEIKEWIYENINFSEYRKKFEAIKVVKGHFGSKASGQTIKDIITKM